VCATALAASAAAACLWPSRLGGSRAAGMAVPPFPGHHGGPATVNQPDGTIAVLLFSAVAAVVVGALVGRTAAGAVGSTEGADLANRPCGRSQLRGGKPSASRPRSAPCRRSSGDIFSGAWSSPWSYGRLELSFFCRSQSRPLLPPRFFSNGGPVRIAPPKTTSNIVMLLCLLVVLAVPLSMFAMAGYRAAAWTLTTSHSSQCSVTRGMSRGAVRKRCGGPTGLGNGSESDRLDLAAAAALRHRVDAYSEHLVLYDCSQRVAGVELFAARGIHRVFKDDFDAQRAASVNPR